MSIALATAWYPRGELPRFIDLLPQLMRCYSGMVVTLPPDVGKDVTQSLGDLNHVRVLVTEDWAGGRHMALQGALEVSTTHIQYADFDRLLRWVETRPEEWLQVVEIIQRTDCLIIGRTERAYGTHPRALTATEAISNQVLSHLLRGSMDFSAGSKGFSRAAVECIMANCEPGHALGTDAEWPIILSRAGFKVDYVTVDGLDWESADRYRPEAAEPDDQRKAALAYDADVSNWERRVDVAKEIVHSGLHAIQKDLNFGVKEIELSQPPSALHEPLFDYEEVFDVDDYLYFHADSLSPERTMTEVDFLVRELELQQTHDILDLACGFGRHTNALATLGYSVTGIDLMPGFLEIAQREAREKQLSVTYLQSDMRRIDFSDKFDRVLLFFTSFGYFEDDENLLVLENVARALKLGGLLVFDTHNRDVFLSRMQPYYLTEIGDDVMIDRVSFDSRTGRMYNRRIVIRDGVRKDKSFFVRMYNPNEISDLIKEAGLEVYKLFGGFDSQPLSSESRRLVIIARKPSDG
jgi:SAM-dependent methyltransferase